MRILVIDDEKNLRESIAEYLSLEQIEAVAVGSGEEGQTLLQKEVFDAVVLDLKMPGISGIELLQWIRNSGPEVPVIMMSAFGEVQDAVNAMKLGARDYLVKPFDPEELVLRLKRIEEEQSLRRKVLAQGEGNGWVGESPAVLQIRKLVEKVAPTQSTILITGESGTGKEVLAREIHRLSTRKNGPFVPVNLGGIPDTLVESELFGYEKGAFTGADRRKEGMFEIASSGTLFLDEIGDMPIHLQVKLLRAIQERKIQRLGGTGFIPIDVRIIAATNRDLEAKVREGTFREDLFYRLNVIRIHLPPLRERPEDIPLLAVHLLEKVVRNLGAPSKRFSPEALEALKQYRFPGNIRELENMVERACILAEGDVILPKDLGILSVPPNRETRPQDSPPTASGTAGTTAGPSSASHEKTLNIKELEREAILEALRRNQGNRTRAAQELGFTRRTLLNKIKEYGIEA
ncbi:MAG: acetoacetate metabolism transcriptional regulator AtoC [Spirochaetales bacterium]